MNTQALNSGATPERREGQKNTPRAAFRPTEPSDQPAIAAFLGRVFDCDSTDPLIQPASMQWRYWSSRPAWPGSRGYVMERDGAILAHGAAWPVQILTGAEPVSAFQLIDWAADPASAGAGLALASKMFQLADVAYVLGGTAEARRMQAPMGFRPRNRVHLMARPLRPFRQIAVDPRWTWKTPARLARNIWWSASGGGPSDPRWSASPCALADLMDNVPVVDEEPGEMRFGDLRELLASLAECPSVRCTLYLVRRDGRPHGYFCMTWAPGQARIVACSVRGSAAEWAQLYRLALDQARSDRRVSEIVTAAATDAQRQALETCGFHSRYADEIALYDRRGRVPADARLHWEMIHGDAAYLHSGRPQFLT